MNQGTRTLHFTIGPVQDFVAQSRRTRDLLAGSFLLSYLSGHAMIQIIREGGSITFPYVQNQEGKIIDPLLQAIDQTVSGLQVTAQPWMGSLPNRFQAEIKEDFNPCDVVKAVQIAWRKVADAVWNLALTESVVQLGNGTKKIWDTQIKSFWDITWVIGEEVNLLDRRKNWRSYIPAEQAGDKCILMNNLQEISGLKRIHQRVQQDRFWSELRKGLGSYQLNEKERLSSIGLIKRLYPLVAKESLGWKFPASAVHFPSTYHLSACPWIVKAMREQPATAYVYGELAEKYKLQTTQAEVNFPSIASEVKNNHVMQSFAQIEGRHLYPHTLAKELDRDEVCHLSGEHKEELQKGLSHLIQALKGEPQTYYALLLMDGDQLGKLLQADKGSQSQRGRQISQSLARFTNGLADRVNTLDGVTVYAGGDDVLALLPMEQALPTAVSLQEKYKQSFKPIREKMKENPTISASIVYAHFHAPLQDVVQHAHYLLDYIAKEQSGRDSLAVGTWRRSGANLVWSAPWEIACEKKEDGITLADSGAVPVTILERLASMMQLDEVLVSRSFLYKLRELYEKGPLFSEDKQENKNIMIELLVADYIRIKGWNKKMDRERVTKQMELLAEICFRSWYSPSPDDERTLYHAKGEFQADGVLLAAFLAQKGVGKRA